MLLTNASARNRDVPITAELRNIPATTAGTTYEHPFFVVPNLKDQPGAFPAGMTSALPLNSLWVKTAYVVAEAAQTANASATNYASIQLNVWRANAGGTYVNTVTLATLPLTTGVANGVNLAALTPVKFPNLLKLQANILKAGDILTLQLTTAGTGGALPVIMVQVDFDPANINNGL